MSYRQTMDFLRSIRFLLSHAMDSVALLFAGAKPGKTGVLRKLLVVRLDAIGDFVLWLDAARELRRLFPSDLYGVTLLGNRLWTSLAERTPYFDEVLPVDRPRFSSEPAYRRGVLRTVRKAGFDIVIQPTFSREFEYGDSVVRFCGAGTRIGSEGNLSNILPLLKRVSDRWYTSLVPASGEPLMELERNAEFMRGLGLAGFRSDVPDLSMIGERPRASMPSEYYVLVPGAGAPFRQWPAERFAAIAGRIHRKTGWAGILCGDPGEKALGELVLGGTDAPLENHCGRTSLPELVSILAGARLVVTNETAAVHIAAAVSTPSVCIMGGGQYGRFLPYRAGKETGAQMPVPVFFQMDCFRCNWRCIYPVPREEPVPCIACIPVDSVWEEVEAVLEKRNRRFPT